MLKPRIIPCLLIQNGGLVKTTNFKHPKYIGDPINAVKIFNEKEVDEITIIDIDATRLNKEPNYSLIESLASECRMPLCYGGGVTKPEQVEKIVSLGVEKVAIGAAAIYNPFLIKESSIRVGNQSVVVVLDVKINEVLQEYEIVTHNATKNTGIHPINFSKNVEQLGAGELIVNSVDKDGCMNGYDIELIHSIHSSVNIPITALGGASSLEDLKLLFNRFKVIGASAGSIFVFKGKYKAVLIQYPTRFEKAQLYNNI